MLPYIPVFYVIGKLSGFFFSSSLSLFYDVYFLARSILGLVGCKT